MSNTIFYKIFFKDSLWQQSNQSNHNSNNNSGIEEEDFLFI